MKIAVLHEGRANLPLIWAAAYQKTLEGTSYLTSGYKLIKELGKKGLRGYYFTYEQYRDLAKIKEFENVKSKVIEYGYPAVKSAENIKDVIPCDHQFNSFTKSIKYHYKRGKRLPVFYDSGTNFLDHNSIFELSGINRNFF